ncbi:WXG100 family type VII secretion target [Saccharothrix violaceirubra]|uniref:ESAT-6-like protein n=1 Tax=Saccharothrix violaceirubra TaxID=413306 RepID=A0A7W7WT81_9PSEU|nr:WXG100 family type VII secretion target [Saccharothrix violaceirubra]MBB4962930.1 WXG100 family type VII secretion target [Saccharothrix violaceirubra]
MAGGYGTGTEELVGAATDIVSTDEHVQGILRSLRGTVDTVGASWKGQAATAFQNLINRFDEDARKLQEALRAIAEQMSGSADIYRRQEEEQNQSMGGLLGRLNG